MSFKPTPEQIRIFKFIEKRTENILIEAYAGAGKTTTIVEAVKLLPKDKSIMFLAFNKHIQEELKTKLPEHVRCYTSHGLGMSAIKRKYGDKIQFDEFKADKHINKKVKSWNLDKEFSHDDKFIYLNNMKKLVNLCRLSLTLDKKWIPYIADRYEINKFNKERDVSRILKILDSMTQDRKTFDYTDMVYLPAIDKSIWLFPQDYVIIDECLPHKTYISTTDGKKQIGTIYNLRKKNKKLPHVITYNENLRIFEYKKILNVWCTDEKDVHYVMLGGKRKLKSTINHKFLTLNGWKRLDELKVGDAILTNYVKQPYHSILTPSQKDIFIGSSLGDGNLQNLSKNVSRLRVIHGNEQQEYAKWKADFFDADLRIVEKNGFSEKIAFAFNSCGYYFDDTLLNKENAINELTLKSLAISWMDDGSISRKFNSSYLFSTSYSYELTNQLSKTLKIKWGIDSIIKSGKSSSTNNEYWWLYFNKENTIRLSLLISPYIHKSMDYKICPEHRGNIDNNQWISNENPYGCIVVTQEHRFLKREKTYDMTVEDNHNFIVTSGTMNKTKAENYGIITHNCQDINRAQQSLIQQMLKKDKVSKKQIGRLIAIGDGFQCQPEGTEILMHDGTKKKIEEIQVGDIVTSYNRSEKGQFVGYYVDNLKRNSYLSEHLKSKAPTVTAIKKRKILEPLIVIESDDKISKYTYNHRCMVSLRKDKIKRHVLYLMEKEGWFRIGIAPLWSSSGNDFASFRAKQENATKFWILKSYENKFDAYLDEQYYSTVFGIPQLRFFDRQNSGNYNQKIIDEFYSRFTYDEMLKNSLKILDHFIRSYNHPIWYRELGTHFSKNHMFEVHACNIMPELMNMVHFDVNNKGIRTHGGKKSHEIIRPTYKPINSLSYEEYVGYVYSMNVSKYELYVADGMLTHNSIYGFTGITDRTFNWFKEFPKTKILPLSYSFRCSKAVIRHANTIVPKIQALPDAPEGSVRNGSALEEARDGDFVLCRTTAPLIQLFFQFLTQRKKAIIKGADIGLQIIDLIGKITNIDDLVVFWEQELIRYRIELSGQGVLNPNEHTGYTSLEDKVNTLLFLAKISLDISDLIDKIKTIFTDKLEGIVLSTIHKSKGLEANRVFIIRPDLIPMPMTKNNWQMVQEKNLEYVAITRAKLDLIYDHEWSDEEKDDV